MLLTWFTMETVYLFRGYFSVSTLVILRGWGAESIFSNEDESQSPAIQGWPVGTVLLKPQPGTAAISQQYRWECGVCGGSAKTADNRCST